MEGRTGFGIGNDGAGVELNRAGGERGDFGFTVEAHDHGAARAIDFAECFGEPGNAERVEARGRLVEQENAGAMDERAGDGDTLAHASGEGADGGVAPLEQVNFAEKLFGAGGGPS